MVLTGGDVHDFVVGLVAYANQVSAKGRSARVSTWWLPNPIV